MMHRIDAARSKRQANAGALILRVRTLFRDLNSLVEDIRKLPPLPESEQAAIRVMEGAHWLTDYELRVAADL